MMFCERTKFVTSPPLTIPNQASAIGQGDLEQQKGDGRLAPHLQAKIPVTAIITTRNEAHHIQECVAGLTDLFAEIWVVDSHSSDKTAQLAEAAGAKVQLYRWDGGYPKKREWCLRHLAVSHEWIFFIDADERITPALDKELRQLFNATSPPLDAYWIYNRLEWCGKPLRYGRAHTKIILMRRNMAHFSPRHDEALYHTGQTAGELGEIEGHYQPDISSGAIGWLKASLLHKAAEPLSYWFARHAGYAAWMAAAPQASWQGDKGWRRFAKRAILTLPMPGVIAFCYNYFFYQGWRDGRAGFDYAMAQAFYYWQISVHRRYLRQRR
jgi:glycosyltransferase involved in cell wall biosynthesis